MVMGEPCILLSITQLMSKYMSLFHWHIALYGHVQSFWLKLLCNRVDACVTACIC